MPAQPQWWGGAASQHGQGTLSSPLGSQSLPGWGWQSYPRPPLSLPGPLGERVAQLGQSQPLPLEEHSKRKVLHHARRQRSRNANMVSWAVGKGCSHFPQNPEEGKVPSSCTSHPKHNTCPVTAPVGLCQRDVPEPLIITACVGKILLGSLTHDTTPGIDGITNPVKASLFGTKTIPIIYGYPFLKLDDYKLENTCS